MRVLTTVTRQYENPNNRLTAVVVCLGTETYFLSLFPHYNYSRKDCNTQFTLQSLLKMSVYLPQEGFVF